MATKRPEVLLLVGMSGAGRSASSNVFEDLGYYVIENLPAELVESVVQSNDVTETNKQLVLTIDAKDSSAQKQLKVSLDKLIYSITNGIFLSMHHLATCVIFVKPIFPVPGLACLSFLHPQPSTESLKCTNTSVLGNASSQS